MVIPWRLAWLLLVGASAVGCSRAAASVPPAGGDERRDTGFAVVELFTSEGCSSCPPADDVLRDITSEASRTGRRVYPLAFHVDYWNSLGWPDPYSSEMATRRQESYARVVDQKGMYTPEMVVNGRDAFVGSSGPRATHSIASALLRSEGARISLQAKRVEAGVSVDFTFSTPPAHGTVLRIALIEPETSSRVTAGENAGKTLRHANVVRDFQTVQVDGAKGGRAALHAQAPPNGAVIAFLQDPETMEMVGAAEAQLQR